ncbi:MAG: DNA polymerase IV, partial [Planctomycetes bacterium]|nr:DNA polymerase IV [Planctomycetota bacterium]
MPHRDSALPARTRRILHLDVDAFLASVESSRNPALIGKPLVIGAPPHTRGLVMSCSYEARAFGVHSGMFSREAKKRCPQAIFLPGDSGAANALRARLAALLLRFTPIVEIASIDDFFLDLKGTTRLFGAACHVAEAIQTAAWQELRLPVTIGIGTTKTMARLAGKLGKPRGIAEVLPGQELAFLHPLPVDHLPGVGRSIRRSLEEFAIRTVGDLRMVSKEMLFASFGVPGLTVYDRARAIDPDPVVASCELDGNGLIVRRTPKSIHRDSSFEPEEGRMEHVEAMLAYLVDRAAARLRQHGLCAGSMEVRLHHVDTRSPSQRRRAPSDAHRGRTRKRLPEPSAQTEALWNHARALLRSLPRRRSLVKRVGVSLINLRTSTGYQGSLFSDPASDRALDAATERPTPASRADRDQALDRVLDGLRKRHGFGSVLRGATLPLGED